jgi:hypothetical protein
MTSLKLPQVSLSSNQSRSFVQYINIPIVDGQTYYTQTEKLDLERLPSVRFILVLDLELERRAAS